MKPRYIIIHHSLTEDSRTVSWNAIRRYHMNELHWKDIGYHFGIELIGDEYEILMGRMLNEPGAHCKQDMMNYKSLGICCVGNWDNVVPPERLWDKAVKLTGSLMKVFSIPAKNILGHREVATYKTCPGKAWNMDLFRMHVED